MEWQEENPIRVVGAVDGRCWDRLARSSGLLYPAWVLSAVRRGKQRQFVCWIQVRSTDGKVKLARCLIDNASEVNLVRKGFLQEDETKMSSTPVQLEGVSGHRLDGGDREAELAVRLVKQSVWSVEETVTEEWFAGKFYEASIKYSSVNPGFTPTVCRPWDTGPASSKIRRPPTRPNCIICTHIPRVSTNSRTEISCIFSKMGRNGQGIKKISTRERWIR